MANICIFGDSITWGAWDREGGWAARFKRVEDEKAIAADFEEYNKIYLLGIAGDTTTGLLERFETECRARKPELILFAIGINDSQYINSKDNPRTDLQTFEANINKLITKARQYTQRIIFIGLTKVDESRTMPVEWNPTKYYENQQIKIYNDAIQDICASEKLQFTDVFDVLENKDLVDGLHPDSEGHKKLFEEIKRELSNI